jgi:nucleoside-diphosphate-sugar epimerase
LGRDVDAKILEGIDVLIHAAHDFSVYGMEQQKTINVEGSAKLFNAAAKAGVKKIIFISSISAFEGCQSQYGQAKLLIESLAKRYGAVIFRPGLIYGDQAQGMFGALVRLCRLPILPLVGDGRQTLYMAHIDDVVAAIITAISWDENRPTEPITLAYPQGILFRDLLHEMGRRHGRVPFFFPIPATPLLLGLQMTEACGLRLRTRRDSLVSLLKGNPHPDFSALSARGLRMRSWNEAERFPRS